MTTAVRPLPDHGTLNRRKAYKCDCEPCLAADRNYAAARNRQIAYGRWQPLVDAEPARTHVRNLMAAGLGIQTITRLAGISSGAMTKLLYGERRRNLKPSARIRPATAAKLLSVQASLAVIPDRANIDATGTRRRLQALIAAGWPQRQIAAHSGIDWHCIHEAARAATVNAATARAISRAYAELCTTSPEAADIPERYINQARRIAERERWAPAAAWDNIDDQNEQPEWTGHCGTDRGWRIHRENNQTPCPRCEQAHTAWVAEIAGLPTGERARAMAAARADAAGRGDAIAEDALWLRDQGYTREQIAHRLRASVDYIDHSIKRYLAAAEQEDAA